MRTWLFPIRSGTSPTQIFAQSGTEEPWSRILLSCIFANVTLPRAQPHNLHTRPRDILDILDLREVIEAAVTTAGTCGTNNIPPCAYPHNNLHATHKSLINKHVRGQGMNFRAHGEKWCRVSASAEDGSCVYTSAARESSENLPLLWFLRACARWKRQFRSNISTYTIDRQTRIFFFHVRYDALTPKDFFSSHVFH